MKVIFKAHKLAIEDPSFFILILSTIHAQLTHDLCHRSTHRSIFAHDAMLKAELKVSLIIFKSHLNEYLLERGNMPHGISPSHVQLAETWKEFEQYLWSSDWQWDLRGTYLREGKVVLEDGEQVEWSKKELEDLARDDDGEFDSGERGVGAKIGESSFPSHVDERSLLSKHTTLPPLHENETTDLTSRFHADSDDDGDDDDDKKSFLQKNRKKASKFLRKAKKAFTSPKKSGGR